ncbi:unnamed protein product [Moneuplotes crassus]|uniref:Uncharacterized protein n=1 Tax=Euplotes crassus TaxID=5936 RepID=A0AAD2DB37_EUPCR|nr:unnamed protein product [Moneuplotes crassus]
MDLNSKPGSSASYYPQKGLEGVLTHLNCQQKLEFPSSKPLYLTNVSRRRIKSRKLNNRTRNSKMNQSFSIRKNRLRNQNRSPDPYSEKEKNPWNNKSASHYINFHPTESIYKTRNNFSAEKGHQPRSLFNSSNTISDSTNFQNSQIQVSLDKMSRKERCSKANISSYNIDTGKLIKKADSKIKGILQTLHGLNAPAKSLAGTHDKSKNTEYEEGYILNAGRPGTSAEKVAEPQDHQSISQRKARLRRNAKSLNTSSVVKNGSMRHKDLEDRIERDIEYLIDNPFKLKKFEAILDNIKQKHKSKKTAKHTENFVKKNISFPEGYNRVRKTSYDQKVFHVKNRRYYKEALDREKKIYDNQRWEIFRKNCDREKQMVLKTKIKKARAKHIFTLYNIRQVLRILRNEASKKKEEMVLKNRMRFASKKIHKNYQKSALNLAPTLYDRNVSRIRQSLSFSHVIQNDWYVEKASQCVRWILDEVSFRKHIQSKFINFTKSVAIIQVFYKERLRKKKEKEQRKIWEEARKSYKKKGKSKRHKNRKFSRASGKSVLSKKSLSIKREKEPQSSIFLSEIP